MNKKGFTLVELLVVISIIALLLSILMPSLSKVRKQAKMVVCLSNLRQIALGSFTYEAEYGRLPVHVRELSSDRFGQSGALPKQVTMGIVNPDY